MRQNAELAFGLPERRLPPLADLIAGNEEWLAARVIDYARRHGFAKSETPSGKSWLRSLRRVSAAVSEALEAGGSGGGPALAALLSAAGGHRARGVSLSEFLGLFTGYRRSFQELLAERLPAPDRDGGLERAVGAAFDRLEAVLAEAWESGDAKATAPQRERDKYATIFESLPWPVFVVGALGAVEDANAAATRLFAPRGSLLWPSPEDMGELAAAVDGEGFERRLPTVEGERWFEVKASSLRDGSDRGDCFIVSCIDTSARRHTQIVLEDSERRYRRLFDAMTGGFALHEMIFDERGEARDYRFLDVNPAFEAQTRLKAADIVGRTVLEVLPGTERSWIETYGHVVKTGEDVHFERFSAKLGRYFEVVAYSPEPGRFATISRDITDRKQAEERLRVSEERMRGVMEASPLAITVMTLEGIVETWSPSAQSMFGWTSDDVVGRRIWDVFPEARNDFAAYRESILAGRPVRGFVTRRRHRDGKDLWVSLSAAATTDSQGNVVGIIGEVEDISERKVVEDALRASEEMFRAVLNGCLPQTAILSQDGTVLHVNESWKRFADENGGGHPAHWVGSNYIRICETANGEDSEEAAAVAAALRAILSGERERFEIEYPCHSSSEYRWFKLIACAISGAKRVGALLMHVDITERVLSEHATQQAREAAEAAKHSQSEFLANMSHELRTPLNSILGFSEIMVREMLGPMGVKRYTEYAEDIRMSGQLLLDIINDILDLSRVELGAIQINEETCVVADILNAVARIIGRRAIEKSIAFEIKVADGLPSLHADPLRLKQILLNLASNAVKFTRRGGRVSVSADWDDGLRFVVADTGIGMTVGEIDIALRPFGQVMSAQRRGHQGTGLGLPIAQSLVRLHNGSLDIESTPDHGTTVTVRFPADRAAGGGRSQS